jgi:hypothetical protein
MVPYITLSRDNRWHYGAGIALCRSGIFRYLPGQCRQNANANEAQDPYPIAASQTTSAPSYCKTTGDPYKHTGTDTHEHPVIAIAPPRLRRFLPTGDRKCRILNCASHGGTPFPQPRNSLRAGDRKRRDTQNVSLTIRFEPSDCVMP